MHGIAKKTYPDYPEVTSAIPVANQVTFQHLDELKVSGTFYPNLPVCKTYTKILLNNQNEDDHHCTKDYKRAGRIGAGVLLFWCLEHRECLGFSILRSAESCQSVYAVLSSRFTVMPRFVIYDNACNLFEVTRGTNSSTRIIEIQSYFKKQRSSVTEFILKTTRTAAGRSTVTCILL